MSDPLVTITRCSSLIGAQLVRARLAAEGIEAHLPEELSASVLGEHFDGVGGMRVLVRQAHSARACELLGVARPAEPPGPAPAARGPAANLCAVCRSPRPDRAPTGLLRRIASAAGLGDRRGRACAVCGHRPDAS